MDKISVIFLVNIAILIVSLKINLLQTLKETFRFIWAFLTVKRGLLLFKSNIVVLFVVGCAAAVIIYNLIRSLWIWIYSYTKNKEESPEELLKLFQPDTSVILQETPIPAANSATPEEILHVLLSKIKFFEYIERGVISKVMLQSNQITLQRGDVMNLEDENSLFIVSQGEAIVKCFPIIGYSKAENHQYHINGDRVIKKIIPGDLIGNMFKLLRFVVGEGIHQASTERQENQIQVQISSEKACFFKIPFESFLGAKHALSHIILSRFQKTTFDTIYKYLKISGPFLRLESEFAEHYYDAETSASFLQPLAKPTSNRKREASTVENYQLIMQNSQIHHRIVDLSCYYFSFLLLSHSDSLNSSTSLNELIEESAKNFSSDSIRSFVELFEGKGILKFQNSVKILFYPKGKVFIAEGSKIAGIYLILQGEAKIESGDKHQKFGISSGRFIGIPTVIAMETAFFSATATCDSIVALFSFEAVRMIFESAKQPYISIVKKFLDFNPEISRFADIFFDWKTFSAGQTLAKDGDSVGKIGIVIHGRLRSISKTLGRKTIQSISVKDYTVGDSFWEIECLTNENIQADFHAVRDTEISFITLEAISFISALCPHVPFLISKIVASKALAHKKSLMEINAIIEKPFLPTTNIKTISLLPTNKDIPIGEFASLLVKEMETFESCRMISSEKVIETLGANAFNNLGQLKLHRWLQEIEENYRIVIFIGDYHMSKWNSWIIRQSDCILVVANALCSKACIVTDIDRALEKKSTARKELVMLHSYKFGPSESGLASKWLESRPWIFNQHHIYFPSLPIPTESLYNDDSSTLEFESNSRPSGNLLNSIRRKIVGSMKSNPTVSFLKSTTIDDIRRLCRILLGRSIGLVLGGGGAKGFAHIGIIRALEEHGIKPDIIGGTSMGAYFAACYARDPSFLSLYGPGKYFSSRMCSTWRRLMDLTFPYTAIFTGHSFNKGIWAVFKDTKIEDLWLNFFCVSTNITRYRLEVHQKGYLWRFVRASMTLAGYLPPLNENGDMLVDGGYLNNLPADIMQQLGASFIIACDVGAQTDTSPVDFEDCVNGWIILFKRLFRYKTNTPSMGDIQTRLTCVSGEQKIADVLEMRNCLYMHPPIEGFTTLGFASAAKIIDVGYNYALAQIKRWEADPAMQILFQNKRMAHSPSMAFEKTSKSSQSTHHIRRNSI